MEFLSLTHNLILPLCLSLLLDKESLYFHWETFLLLSKLFAIILKIYLPNIRKGFVCLFCSVFPLRCWFFSHSSSQLLFFFNFFFHRYRFIDLVRLSFSPSFFLSLSFKHTIILASCRFYSIYVLFVFFFSVDFYTFDPFYC